MLKKVQDWDFGLSKAGHSISDLREYFDFEKHGRAPDRYDGYVTCDYLLILLVLLVLLVLLILDKLFFFGYIACITGIYIYIACITGIYIY